MADQYQYSQEEEEEEEIFEPTIEGIKRDVGEERFNSYKGVVPINRHSIFMNHLRIPELEDIKVYSRLVRELESIGFWGPPMELKEVMKNRELSPRAELLAMGWSC